MATIDYMHLCDHAFLGANARPGFVGIFDVIYTQTFPCVYHLLSVGARFRGMPNEIIPFVASVEASDGEVIKKLEGAIPADRNGLAFLAGTFLNINFPSAGRYHVTITSAGKPLASQALQLHQIEPSTR